MINIKWLFLYGLLIQKNHYKKVLKEKNVFIKEYEKSLIIDKVLFTTDETEFQGIGLFTGREHVFLVSESELTEIKNYLVDFLPE